MEQAVFHFQLEGTPLSCEPYGCGHINRTYLLATERRRYILQRINTAIFTDVDGLMANIAAVSRFLAAGATEPRQALTLVPAADGAPYYRDETGCWRVYEFIEDSVCLQAPETEQDFYESAMAFGGFQQRMAAFDAATLHETIPDFHNTVARYAQLQAATAADTENRVKEVTRELDFVLAREREGGTLHRERLNGTVPLRVTHNDTKLNNVMLDAKTRKALCVIDLDTVMPGLSLYDFGDSIRFGAATAAEDERDLSKVEMSLRLFRIYTRGYVRACPSLTRREKELLAQGAKLMTLECGIRFLTDYISGDHYFAIHRPTHNLDRARTQFKLVADMETKWDEMEKIVEEETAQ